MKLRKPFIILLLSVAVLSVAESCKSKGVYGRSTHKGKGCDCPGIGKH